MPTGTRPPIPPGYAKLVQSGTIFGHQVKNVFALALAGSSIGNSDLTSLLNSIETSRETNLRAQQSADYVWTGFELTYIPTVGTERVASLTGGVAGTLAGTTVPDASASYVLDWLIGQYYRGGHPRTYLAGVVGGDITNGSSVSAARRTALVTAANAWLNAINALTTTNITSVQLGTLSFVRAKAWRTPPVFYPYTGSKVAPFVGSQRRRIHS